LLGFRQSPYGFEREEVQTLQITSRSLLVSYWQERMVLNKFLQ